VVSDFLNVLQILSAVCIYICMYVSSGVTVEAEAGVTMGD